MTTNGGGGAQGNGDATGTSESFAEPAPNAPQGTNNVNIFGGVAGQSNPNNLDGGPTPVVVSTVGDVILATNLAQLPSVFSK
jgi:hypothetical protein